VQCVDCVREGAKSIRTARTALGGRPGDGTPVVTRGLVAVNVVAFVLQLAAGSRFTDALDFYPPDAVAQPWRFLTAGFLHSQGLWLHILLNMYALWLVGPYLESLLGRARFIALYLLSAVGGSVGYFLIADPRGSAWGTSVIGASGAVFGLFGAYLVINRRLGRDSSAMAGAIAINLVFGFVVAGIAWQAHLGGLVTGAATAVALAYVPAERRSTMQPVVLGVLAALLVVAVLVKAATVPAGLLS
jgi:membrane associated rhomboid family serine protease